jgi:hypothetical protein
MVSGSSTASGFVRIADLIPSSRRPSCTQNRALPTHHRTPDAPRWRSRLALDVGEGQKQTRCIDSPVRRRGGVKRGENGVILHGKIAPPVAAVPVAAFAEAAFAVAAVPAAAVPVAVVAVAAVPVAAFAEAAFATAFAEPFAVASVPVAAFAETAVAGAAVAGAAVVVAAVAVVTAEFSTATVVVAPVQQSEQHSQQQSQ